MVLLFLILFAIVFGCIYVPVWLVRRRRDKHTLWISFLGAVGFAGAFVNMRTSYPDDILYALVIGALCAVVLLFFYSLTLLVARAIKQSGMSKDESNKTDW